VFVDGTATAGAELDGEGRWRSSTVTGRAGAGALSGGDRGREGRWARPAPIEVGQRKNRAAWGNAWWAKEISAWVNRKVSDFLI
jgi:hypothetical protein